MIDLTFPTEGGTFNFRVGAIILDGGRLLVNYSEAAAHFWSIGGRVKLHETTHDAALREAFEETGIEYEIDRLLYVHESFFSQNDERFHEVAFFYLMRENELTALIPEALFDTDEPEYLAWLPLERLGEFDLRPEFLKDAICKIKSGDEIKHIVTE